MSEKNWVSEPWEYRNEMLYSGLDHIGDVPENGENGDRIVACVNGCAQIPSPDGLGDLVKAMKIVLSIKEGGRLDKDSGTVEGLHIIARQTLRACGIEVEAV